MYSLVKKSVGGARLTTPPPKDVKFASNAKDEIPEDCKPKRLAKKPKAAGKATKKLVAISKVTKKVVATSKKATGTKKVAASPRRSATAAKTSSAATRRQMPATKKRTAAKVRTGSKYWYVLVGRSLSLKGLTVALSNPGDSSPTGFA